MFAAFRADLSVQVFIGAPLIALVAFIGFFLGLLLGQMLSGLHPTPQAHSSLASSRDHYLKENARTLTQVL